MEDGFGPSVYPQRTVSGLEPQKGAARLEKVERGLPLRSCPSKGASSCYLSLQTSLHTTATVIPWRKRRKGALTLTSSLVYGV